MNPSTLFPFEPTEEDVQFLNDVDKGYVGLTKPKIIHIIEDYVPVNQLEIEDGDHLRIDEQGFD